MTTTTTAVVDTIDTSNTSKGLKYKAFDVKELFICLVTCGVGFMFGPVVRTSGIHAGKASYDDGGDGTTRKHLSGKAAAKQNVYANIVVIGAEWQAILRSSDYLVWFKSSNSPQCCVNESMNYVMLACTHTGMKFGPNTYGGEVYGEFIYKDKKTGVYMMFFVGNAHNYKIGKYDNIMPSYNNPKIVIALLRHMSPDPFTMGGRLQYVEGSHVKENADYTVKKTVVNSKGDKKTVFVPQPTWLFKMLDVNDDNVDRIQPILDKNNEHDEKLKKRHMGNAAKTGVKRSRE